MKELRKFPKVIFILLIEGFFEPVKAFISFNRSRNLSRSLKGKLIVI